MALPEILGGAGLAVGAVGSIAQMIQQAEAERKAEQRRKAMRKYLEKNMGEFNPQYAGFDESKYSDILQPMRERQQGQNQQLGASLAQQGLGRSGIGNELVMRNISRGTSDIGNKIVGLRRSDEEEAYRRAYQKYLANLERTKAIANTYT